MKSLSVPTFTMLDDREIYKQLLKLPAIPETLLILGSGWNHVLTDAIIREEVPYSSLFGVPAGVPGHEGRLVVGLLNNTPAAFMSGRIHMYEGHGAYESTAPIRAFARAGVKKLILTAACGALNETYRVGDTVILNDMITLLLSPDSPLVGPEFIDTSCVFDPVLRKKALDAAKKHHIPYREGSYIYYHGPNFETPGDKRAMRILGADVCGMSTVPETLAARALGMRVLGLSFVTNLAFVKHDHREVLREAEKGRERMSALLQDIVTLP